VSTNLRELPAVHEVVTRLGETVGRFPRTVVVQAVRTVLDEIRAGRGDGSAIEARVLRALERLEASSLRRVINATGVVLHTNLGRAPLGGMRAIGGYSNL